jgi:hypothetical protein
MRSRPNRTGFNRLLPSDLQRAIVELQERLGHSSLLHDDRDELTLRAAVLGVGKLIGRVSDFSGSAAIKTKEGIEEDWKLGWAGIVKEPVKVRKAQKPKLTLDGYSSHL